jgi:putative acyl-CoA dehydrogenase
MTSAAVPILREHEYKQEWYRNAVASGYDTRDVPISEKSAVTIGMSMTEKQVFTCWCVRL